MGERSIYTTLNLSSFNREWSGKSPLGHSIYVELYHLKMSTFLPPGSGVSQLICLPASVQRICFVLTAVCSSTSGWWRLCDNSVQWRWHEDIMFQRTTKTGDPRISQRRCTAHTLKIKHTTLCVFSCYLGTLGEWAELHVFSPTVVIIANVGRMHKSARAIVLNEYIIIWNCTHYEY